MSEKIKIAGLCGRSGSGKGYVCRIFEEMGIPSIDTDAVYRSLVTGGGSNPSPCLTAIAEAFGAGVLNAAGDLNRQALADFVFARGAGACLQRLNAITHKYIKEATQRQIVFLEKAGYRAVLIDAPVLFESGFDKLCDVIFYVCAPDTVLIQRICARDGITEEQARRRLDAQMSDAELALRCDGVIRNDGFSDVKVQVAKLTKQFSLRT